MTRRFPCLDAATKDFHLMEPLRLVFFRPPGGGSFVWSRTVENDFLVP